MGKGKLPDNYDEDLDKTISIFEAMTTICEVDLEVKLKAVPT